MVQEYAWAERFSRDVDNLLDEIGTADTPPLPPDYGPVLHLARTLATTDFSAASQVRQTLRYRLLSQEGAPQGRTGRRRPVQSALPRPRLAVIPLVAVILILSLLATLAWPEPAEVDLQGMPAPGGTAQVDPGRGGILEHVQDEPLESETTYANRDGGTLYAMDFIPTYSMAFLAYSSLESAPSLSLSFNYANASSYDAFYADGFFDDYRGVTDTTYSYDSIPRQFFVADAGFDSYSSATHTMLYSYDSAPRQVFVQEVNAAGFGEGMIVYRIGWTDFPYLPLVLKRE